MEVPSGPDKDDNMRVDIRLERHHQTGMWRDEVYAYWGSRSETCDYIGGSDEYVYATRADAAVAAQAVVVKWLAKNA
jgi:uncharacterized protein YjlB